tara:strand:+ start:846 stop:1172 length:327 start_codon:yes stop_codon:yes gene_type:complete
MGNNSLPYAAIASIEAYERCRVDRLAVLAMLCKARGGNADDFYRDYLEPTGTFARLNPFRDRNGQYAAKKVFNALRRLGYGAIPEFASCVFWQESTLTVWENDSHGQA